MASLTLGPTFNVSNTMRFTRWPCILWHVGKASSVAFLTSVNLVLSIDVVTCITRLPTQCLLPLMLPVALCIPRPSVIRSVRVLPPIHGRMT